MKSRVPLAGYIGALLLYWIFLPAFAITYSSPIIVTFAGNVLISKIFLDTAVSLFIGFSLIFSRVFFIGSDLDNLLITGVSKWRLAGGIFIFIALFITPIILLFDRALLIIPLAYSVPGIFLNLSTIALYFLFITMALVSMVIGLERSFYAVLLISLVDFANLIGNPVSMGNLGNSQYIWGFAALIIVFASLIATLLVSISRSGFAPYRIVRKRRREEVRTPIDFSGREPGRVSFWLGFSFLFPVAVNNNSTRAPRYGRIRTWRSLAYLIVLNIALAILLTYFYHVSAISSNGFVGDFVVILSSLYTTIIIWGLVSTSLAQERIWVMGATIGGRRFLKNHVLSKSALFSALLLPTMIPLAGMAIAGQPLFLRLGLVLTGTLVVLAFPAAVLALIISGFMLPEQYVKSEMPTTGVLSFFVISIPMIFVAVAGIVAYFDLWFLPAAVASMYALALIALARDSLYDRVFHSLILRRFI